MAYGERKPLARKRNVSTSVIGWKACGCKAVIPLIICGCHFQSPLLVSIISRKRRFSSVMELFAVPPFSFAGYNISFHCGSINVIEREMPRLHAFNAGCFSTAALLSFLFSFFSRYHCFATPSFPLMIVKKKKWFEVNVIFYL